MGQLSAVRDLHRAFYNRLGTGALEALPFTNIDVGMGLERNTFLHARLNDIYDIDVFKAARGVVLDLGGSRASTHDQNIIIEHARAIQCIASDAAGIIPANKGAGYILRRLIRRATHRAHQVDVNFAEAFGRMADIYVHEYKAEYPEFGNNLSSVKSIVGAESTKFSPLKKW